MLRRPWIAAFVGAALRRELTTDPDGAFDVADQLYPAWCNSDAGSVFASLSAGNSGDDPEIRRSIPGDGQVPVNSQIFAVLTAVLGTS